MHACMLAGMKEIAALGYFIYPVYAGEGKRKEFFSIAWATCLLSLSILEYISKEIFFLGENHHRRKKN